MYKHYNTAKQLRRCYPEWLREFREIDALLSSQTELLEAVKSAVSRMIANQNIYTADEETLKLLEEFLHIEYKHEREAKERMRLICSHFVGNGRFGIDEILEIVAIFTDSSCVVTYENGKINVRIARNIQDSFISGDCLMMLEKRKPAHLLLTLNTVNPFTLNAYTGTAMSEYRIEELGSRN